MAIYGTSFQDAGTQASYNTGQISVNSVSYANVVTVNNLDAGTYIAHFCITPSTDSGPYPNGDPDHWETRITLDGTQVGDTAYGYESAPRTYYTAGSLTTVISWRSGAKTIASQYRTTDGDAGGMRGYLITQIAIIMEYA